MRLYIFQLREGGSRGGRGSNDNCSTTNFTMNLMTKRISANGNTNDSTSSTNAHSVVSDITDRCSQNGRSFGRGVYNNNIYARTECQTH